MIFRKLDIPGAFVVEPERNSDERGYFARTFCAREFATRGLVTQFVQMNASWNRVRGTLRGMHYQVPPHAEVKLVRCTRAAVHDVIIDLRQESPVRGKWVAVELSAANGWSIYIPAGVAHGFMTLADDAEVSYAVTSFFEPSAARGVRWNDPAFAIDWPEPPRVILARDSSYPDWGTS